MNTIQEIYEQVQALSRKIGATPGLLPTFGTSELNGKPYIVIRGDTYYYLANDRDVVTINRQTASLQELLYWIFDEITYQMGAAYELEHRVPDLDSRRLIFKKQLDLLQKIDPEWKQLKQQEIKDILGKHPYRDAMKR